MNDIAYKQAIQAIVKAKFKGHKKRICKTKPIYPQGVEREFQRLTDAYMKVLNDVVKEYLPEIKSAAAANLTDGYRQDGLPDLLRAISDIFSRMMNRLLEKLDSFPMIEKLGKVAYRAQKLSIREWKRTVHATLGIDILEDYYKGEFYREMLERWIETNVSLIKTIPQESLEEMRHIVLEGYKSGKSTAAIIKEIQKEYDTSKHHARLLARDQLAKLNGQLAKQQQQDAGVKEYIWSDSDDQRVRDCHAALNGKRFRWDNPPEMWYWKGRKGQKIKVYTGRRCHPGEDYQCRCVALPVFDMDTIDLPVTGKGSE